jgi:four helix bundle protein
MATELEEMRVLQIAEQFADEVWRIVSTWDSFSREVVGRQIVRSADSIGANIAESYGRFHYGEKVNLLYYARGSTFETKYWLNRCRERKLVTDDTAKVLIAQLNDIARQINGFARHFKAQRGKDKPNVIRESSGEYSTSDETTPDEIFSSADLERLESNELNPQALENF